MLVLDANTTASVNRLRTVYNNVTSLLAQTPTPSQLASNLTTLSSTLTIGSTANFTTDLNNVDTAVFNVPLATLTGARTQLATVQ